MPTVSAQSIGMALRFVISIGLTPAIPAQMMVAPAIGDIVRPSVPPSVVIAILTEKGQALKEQARQVPEQMGCHLANRGVTFSPDEITALKGELYKILNGLK